MKTVEIYRKYISKNPAKLMLFMYIVVILIGTFLLMLPISSSDMSFTNFIDSFFTVVSAICVTGLTTLTTATYWSLFGKVVIIILIQLGGLGIMTAASIVALIFNKKMSISDRMKLSEEKNTVTIEGVVRIIKFIIYSTFIIELIGAFLMSIYFIPYYGLLKGIGVSIFQSISAFCNAGFDVIGETSIVPFALNINISLVTSLLIIIGGIGHTVIKELLIKKFNYKKYSLHTKLTLIMTGLLLFVPTILFIFIEYNNPNTLKEYNIFQKFLLSFFESTTLRTAGFYTTIQQNYLTASSIIMILLMFIGGSPAGTAGGFKTTTFATLFLITKANVKKDKEVNVFNKRLPEEIDNKVIAIFTISLVWIISAMFLLAIANPDFSILDITYEVVSAYGTVGLTRGLTTSLSSFSKIIICITMIFGKIGPISIIAAFINSSKPKVYKNQKESILIG